MANYRNANYAAFYVAEPFNSCNLGAHATPDFCYYNMLKAWKGKDSSFPFVDAHDKTYNVRDNSDWETTLKPRLRERLRQSKNIVLFLSSNTKESRALKEEIEYGVGVLGLPLIIVYPELTNSQIHNNYGLMNNTINLWDKLPVLKKYIHSVPSLHIPLEKSHLTNALNYSGTTIQTPATPNVYWYK